MHSKLKIPINCKAKATLENHQEAALHNITDEERRAIMFPFVKWREYFT